MPKRQILRFVTAVLLVASSCSGPTPKPTSDEVVTALKEYYAARGTQPAGIKVVRFGESGRADFSAPGSQDLYWAVEFNSSSEEAAKLGPIELISSPNVHGVAHVYRTKMGRWKVTQIER